MRQLTSKSFATLSACIFLGLMATVAQCQVATPPTSPTFPSQDSDSRSAANALETSSALTGNGRSKVILDTDIGDDIDDAFALSLALHSPEIELVGITTAWGDTNLRARLVQRLLTETGHANIPIAEGIVTQSTIPFSQARWAQQEPAPKQHVDAVDFLLRQIRANPGQITLVAIAPLTNIGAAIDRDPATFKKLKRVVLMGGSVRRGYDGPSGAVVAAPSAEYNIRSDVASAQKLFASGVVVFMMPLDSTQLKLDEVKRARIFTNGTPTTDALTLLYHQWGQPTPTLFDVMPVAYVVAPKLCHVTPLHITVDESGYTREGPGRTNALACLASDSEQFFNFVMPRLLEPPAK
jgi:inosine-uridine nucleoside N-ribohydrolase